MYNYALSPSVLATLRCQPPSTWPLLIINTFSIHFCLDSYIAFMLFLHLLHRFDTENPNKCDIFNGIVLIQVACSSFPRTLSLYDTFMWTVGVKAAQSELNESDGRPYERRNSVRTSVRHERTYHHVAFLNLYIDMSVLRCNKLYISYTISYAC